jgi:prevent-host-death family protein
MNVGVRELKQGLSGYLDLVAGGEIVTVTDRGKPKAFLIPISNTGAFQRGIDEGWIREAKNSGLRPVRRRVTARRSIASVLAEDRDE